MFPGQIYWMPKDREQRAKKTKKKKHTNKTFVNTAWTTTQRAVLPHDSIWTIYVSLTTKVPAPGSRESVTSMGRVYEDEFIIDGFATGDFLVAVGLVVGGLWFNEMQKAS